MKELKESSNYLIDNEGNIYNKSTSKKLNSKGWTTLTSIDGWHKSFYMARIIANNLIPNPKNYEYITFKDGDKTNINVGNLQWSETVYGEAIFSKKVDKFIRSKISIMASKCHIKTDRGYKHYGKKGIKVYKEWREDTLEFVRWSKLNGYYEGAFLLRYDKKEDFTPDNCYWGNDIPNAKLNCDMVEDIKDRLKITTPKIIANKYQVSHNRILQIRNGATLKNCEE